MSKQTVRIQCILHPSSDEEKSAIKIYLADKANGFTPRQIITDAINRKGNKTPEMFRQDSGFRAELYGMEDRIMERMNDLQQTLENDIIKIMRDLKKQDPVAFKKFADIDENDSGDLEFDQEFIQNAKKSVRKSFRQKQKNDNDDD